MIARLARTKRAMTIELVLASILVIAFVYTRLPADVPATSTPSVPQLVATPAPVPSWTFSVVPETKHTGRKAKPLQIAKPAPAVDPTPVPMIAKSSPDVIESVPATVPKEAALPATEIATAIANPVVAPALEATPELSVPAPADKEALNSAPATVPNEALAAAPDAESSPTPKEIPASVLSTSPAPAGTLPAKSATTTQTTSLVGGTAAALAFAPIAAPVSIILGIAVGLFEPSSSELGQEKPTAKAKAKKSNTNSSSSSSNANSSPDSGY